MECTPEHNAQLVDYLRYMRRKRDAAIAEVTADFNDAKEGRLFDPDEQFMADDVRVLLDDLIATVRATMKRDLQSLNFGSVLLLKQIFEQAEQSRLSMQTDLTGMEDMNLVGEVERWDADVHGGNSSAPLRARAAGAIAAPSRGNARALPVIGQAQDPKLVAELQNARDDTASLQVCTARELHSHERSHHRVRPNRRAGAGAFQSAAGAVLERAA